ncbi:hypothetical protein ACFS2C_02920 [Prauserella oleivorans]|uniref:Uncharacterized protein n=1 Tax=Prauserella oleivorans TaxID=1478153 RepID=A0ABW5W317_9PSEU
MSHHRPLPLKTTDRVRVPRKTQEVVMSHHRPLPLKTTDRVRVPRKTQEVS